jgi:hypothetical protein
LPKPFSSHLRKVVVTMGMAIGRTVMENTLMKKTLMRVRVRKRMTIMKGLVRGQSTDFEETSLTTFQMFLRSLSTQLVVVEMASVGVRAISSIKDTCIDFFSGYRAKSTVTLPFGKETLQNPEMKKLGIIINLKYRIAICTLCETTIIPAHLYKHLHCKGGCLDHQDFRKGGRLAFCNREYCDKLIGDHKLQDPMKLHPKPKAFPTAIPGLPVYFDQYCCDICGSAFKSKGVLIKHKKMVKTCGNAEIIVGPAQVLSPGSKLGWIGIKLPSHPSPSTNPDNSVMLFNQQFGSDPYSEVNQIQATSHPREMRLFLASENWLAEVEGMTGPEIRELSRSAMPEYQAAVKSAVARYISGLVSELSDVGPSERLAIGDYNK